MATVKEPLPNDRIAEPQTDVEDLTPRLEESRRYGWKILQIVLFLLALMFLWHMNNPFNQPLTTIRGSPSADIAPSKAELLRPQTWPKCASAPVNETTHFGFNMTDSEIKAWGFGEASDPESRDSFHGNVIIGRGSWDQSSDIEVFVTVISNDTADVEQMCFVAQSDALLLIYKSSGISNVFINVEVRVYLRPGPLGHINEFRIWNRIFNVVFESELGVEIDNLTVSTYWGWIDILGSVSIDPLIVTNMSLTSMRGAIYGDCIIPGDDLTVVNHHAGIRIRLCPKLLTSPDSPFEPKSIDISSGSGDVTVEYFWDMWPAQPYSHRTTIHSRLGYITATIPLGSYTNISSINGSLDVVLQPYNTDTEDSFTEIYTSTELGNIAFVLDEPHSGSLGKYNPLEWLLSMHEVRQGIMDLRYPDSWYGIMEGRVEKGDLTLDGSQLEIVERGKGYVMAYRGSGKMNDKSHMMAYVKEGDLDICLGYNPEMGVSCESDIRPEHNDC